MRTALGPQCSGARVRTGGCERCRIHAGVCCGVHHGKGAGSARGQAGNGIKGRGSGGAQVRECEEYVGVGGEVADLSPAQLAHYHMLQVSFTLPVLQKTGTCGTLARAAAVPLLRSGIMSRHWHWP